MNGSVPKASRGIGPRPPPGTGRRRASSMTSRQPGRSGRSTRQKPGASAVCRSCGRPAGRHVLDAPAHGGAHLARAGEAHRAEHLRQAGEGAGVAVVRGGGEEVLQHVGLAQVSAPAGGGRARAPTGGVLRWGRGRPGVPGGRGGGAPPRHRRARRPPPRRAGCARRRASRRGGRRLPGRVWTRSRPGRFRFTRSRAARGGSGRSSGSRGRDALGRIPDQAVCSTSNAARLRASLLNSTATRWIGWPRCRYLSA